MSKKAKQYSATEKTKIVLEAIKSELTIAQISSKYGVHSTQISAWKKRGIESLVNGFQIKPATRDPDNQDLIPIEINKIMNYNMKIITKYRIFQ